MSQLNCVGCEKQNVHSQTCSKFLRFLLVFMYFRNKFSKKKKTIKMSAKFVSSISFKYKLISCISEYCFLNHWRQAN